MLSTRDPLHAGWKGMRVYAPYLQNEVIWIEDQAASLFHECMVEIMEFHHSVRTLDRHPWLFVNLGRKSGSFGEPVRMNRVQKAFGAACKRAGYDPLEVSGMNIHNLRHHYYDYLKQTLEVGSETRAVAMGHKSVNSQEAYGEKHLKANSEIRKAMTRKNPDDH